MPEGSTPAAAAAPAAGGGTPPDPLMAPGAIAEPPKDATPEQLTKHWESEAKRLSGRHIEATTKIEEQGKELGNLRPLAKKSDAQTPPAPATAPAPTDALTRAEYQKDKLKSSLPPNLQPHADEVQGYLDKGIEPELAISQVAKKHNVALGPSQDWSRLGQLPGSGPSGGNRDGGSEQSAGDVERDKREGITPEMRTKHAGTLQQMWKNKGRG